MKIEMGESLFYSWLRHVKECQIVQTNWKTSGQWTLLHEDELEKMMAATDSFFLEKYGYSIYKKTSSLSQLLLQAECDAIGISKQDGVNKVYAVDVAFHESGVNYGNKVSTIMKITAKCLRTAMCIYGYLDTKEAEIVFASPKVNPSVLQGVIPCLEAAQRITDDLGYGFKFRLFANDDFYSRVLQPILKVSGGVSDTNELFIRGYHMLQMFNKSDGITNRLDVNGYEELKIGKLAQLVMRPILESGTISEGELKLLQDKEYCKKTLDLGFPLLVNADGEFDKVRYYKAPLTINGTKYLMCSQWAEGKANNDRPYLEKWIQEHQHFSPMKTQVPDGTQIACKDCVHRDRTIVHINGKDIPVGVTKVNCDMITYPDDKPSEVLFLNAECPFYEREILTLEDFVSEYCHYGVKYLGSVGLCDYYLETYPDDEDIGEPSVVMASGNEYYFCEQDVALAVIGLFSGSAIIDIDDPHSTGIWKRIFNVTELELIKAVGDVGNSAVDIKEHFMEKR